MEGLKRSSLIDLVQCCGRRIARAIGGGTSSMPEPFRKALRAHRDRHGLGADRLATLMGIALGSYRDLEMYKDEWWRVTPAYKIIFACRLLEIDLLQYMPDQGGDRIERVSIDHEVIKSRRESVGLSRADFADQCGFYPEFAVVVESGGLVTYSFGIIWDVCRVLSIDTISFVRNALLAPM